MKSVEVSPTARQTASTLAYISLATKGVTDITRATVRVDNDTTHDVNGLDFWNNSEAIAPDPVIISSLRAEFSVDRDGLMQAAETGRGRYVRVADRMAQDAGVPVVAVLVTHWHYDHFFGLAGVAFLRGAKSTLAVDGEGPELPIVEIPHPMHTASQSLIEDRASGAAASMPCPGGGTLRRCLMADPS